MSKFDELIICVNIVLHRSVDQLEDSLNQMIGTLSGGGASDLALTLNQYLNMINKAMNTYTGKSSANSYLSLVKPASHCPMITESEGTQAVVQSDEICSNCFGPIVLIPLPDRWAIFLNDWKITPDHRTESDLSDYCPSSPIMSGYFVHDPI